MNNVSHHIRQFIRRLLLIIFTLILELKISTSLKTKLIASERKLRGKSESREGEKALLIEWEHIKFGFAHNKSISRNSPEINSRNH